MARLLSNKILCVMFTAALSIPVYAADYECNEVEIHGQVVKESEKLTLCFLKDPSYFISKNCVSLDCAFIARLRKARITQSTHEGPGSSMCRELGGLEEEIKVASMEDDQIRCVFPEDRSTISLNLLESWNGKYFAGPGKSIKF